MPGTALPRPDRRRLLDAVGGLVPVGVLLVAWEVAAGRVVPAAILPPFSAVWAAALRLWGAGSPAIGTHLADTLLRSAAGVALATAVGLPLGLAMAQHDGLRRHLDPVVRLTYPSPKSPLIPILIFWLGVGNRSRIVLAVAGALPAVVLSTLNGADDVDRELVWSARSMGVGRVAETLRVVLPASLPTVLTGVRIGTIFSFVIVISSEMILARTGVGVLVVRYGEYGQYTELFAVVFWAVVLVAGADRCYLAVSRYLLRWSERGVSGV